jgi:spore germination protein YaaH
MSPASFPSRIRAAARLIGALGLLSLAAPAAPGAAPRPPLFVAFHDGWDPAGRRELAARLGSMDVFAPRWITVRGPSAEVVVEPDPGAPAQIAGLRRPPRLFPIVSNAHDDVWDGPAVQRLVQDPAARAAFAARLAGLAAANGYGGYVLDFENLPPQAAQGYPALIAELKAAMAPYGREVWVTAGVGPDQPLASYAAAADAVVLMAYDECWANSTPGPIAGQDWLGPLLAQRLAGLDPQRVIVALASYGYDWPKGGGARAVGVEEARALAARSGAAVRRDPASGNARFDYMAGGRARQVWFVDAPAFAAQERIGAAFRVRGVALWRLGLEDPAIWRLPRPGAANRTLPAVKPGAALPHPCDPLPAR